MDHRSRRLFAVVRNDRVLLLAQAEEPDQAIAIASTMVGRRPNAANDDPQAKCRQINPAELRARPATDQEQRCFAREAAYYRGDVQLAAMYPGD